MSDSDDDFGAPPPALVQTGDFTARPPALQSQGTAVFSGSAVFGDATSSPQLLSSPGTLHSPASSFRWDRHQSFRLYATHSRAAMSRRATGNFESGLLGGEHSLGGSVNLNSENASPLTDSAQTVRAAQSRLKNFIMLNGHVHGDSSLPANVRKGKLIGSGGYADVFSGMNTQSNTLVAIKEIKIGDRSSPSDFKDIQDEFALLRRLKHQNIVGYILFEHSVSQKLCRIVMEFMPGGSTQQLLQKFGPLPEPILKKFATDMLRGIEFIHKEGITHRDLKPANILVDAQGTVKLADFGASKKIHEVNAPSNLIGTPVYMAPEFVKGQVETKSDIWAMGCTLLELATGKMPWYHLNIKENLKLMFHITTSSDIPKIPDDISDEFKAFFALCFERVVAKRPSATQLLTHAWITNITADDMEAQQAIEDIGADQTESICCALSHEGPEKSLGDSCYGTHHVLESPDVTPKSLNLTPMDTKLSSLGSGLLKPPSGVLPMQQTTSSNSNFDEGFRTSSFARSPGGTTGGYHSGLSSPRHSLVEQHDAPQQYLAIKQDPTGGSFELATVFEDDNEGQTSQDTAFPTIPEPTAAARRESLKSNAVSFTDDVSTASAFPDEDMEPPHLGIEGPVKMSFTFNSAGRKVDLGLNVEPRDVSVKVIDRRKSFVVNMNDRIRNQITKAMVDMGDQLDSPGSSPSSSPPPSKQLNLEEAPVMESEGDNSPAKLEKTPAKKKSVEPEEEARNGDVKKPVQIG